MVMHIAKQSKVAAGHSKSQGGLLTSGVLLFQDNAQPLAFKNINGIFL